MNSSQNPDLLANLNEHQIAAVTHRQGPLLVFAGAGSGKTRVITRRIAWLIEQGIAPAWQILALTFTNKAAREMIDRIHGILGPRAEGVTMGTFHSTCARWLRREIDNLGFSKDFAIFDELDSLSLIKEILRNLDLDPALASAFYGLIERLKNDGIVGVKAEQVILADYAQHPHLSLVFREYQERLRLCQSLDFNDLLLKTLELFDEFPEILERFQNRYRYILVDEYQDTNKIQHELLIKLGNWGRNITVVGDDDQSIYGWRGADFNNIFKLKETFPDLTIVTLAQNYRSTQTILNAAISIVKHNPIRHHKDLVSHNSEGDPVRVFRGESEQDEAEFVSEQILRLRSDYHYEWKDFAIFYRINAQSRLFEEHLKARSVPFTIVGGVGFYRRQEIKDVIAYLRAIINPADIPAYTRIMNKPPRNLGGKTQELIYKLAVEHNLTFLQAIETAVNNHALTGKRAESALAFVALINELREQEKKRQLQDFVHLVLTRSGYLRLLQSSDQEDSRSREDNVLELINAISAFEKSNPGAHIRDFLESISLLSDVDELSDSDDRVTLMTLHSAKGLEFEIVFLTGLEEGLFPLIRNKKSESVIDEERRLCYVGMTRAKNLLFMTYARSRLMWGQRMTKEQSRFLSELPSALYRPAPRSRFQSSKPYQPYKREVAPSAAPRTTAALGSQAVSPPAGAFPKGAKVLHPKFGLGEVLRCTKAGDDWKVEVAFIRAGSKTLMAGQAKLRKI